MKRDLPALLKNHRVQPSAQRVAVAAYILDTEDHPTAEQVWSKVRARFPMISRATVYNTLNLFVAKGLLRELTLEPGRVVFDPRVERHHHFIDEGSGRVHDVPWEALEVRNLDALAGFSVREHQVVMRGSKVKTRRGE